MNLQQVMDMKVPKEEEPKEDDDLAGAIWDIPVFSPSRVQTDGE